MTEHCVQGWAALNTEGKSHRQATTGKAHVYGTRPRPGGSRSTSWDAAAAGASAGLGPEPQLPWPAGRIWPGAAAPQTCKHNAPRPGEGPFLRLGDRVATRCCLLLWSSPLATALEGHPARHQGDCAFQAPPRGLEQHLQSFSCALDITPPRMSATTSGGSSLPDPARARSAGVITPASSPADAAACRAMREVASDATTLAKPPSPRGLGSAEAALARPPPGR